MYAWERSFEKQVIAIRVSEIGALKKISWYDSGFYFLFNSVPFLVCNTHATLITRKTFLIFFRFSFLKVSVSSFTTFVLMNANNVLTANIVFVSLALFNTLQIPMVVMP